MQRRALALLFLALSGGCNPSVVSDANEVLYPSEVSLVEGPGRLLLPGRFHTLTSAFEQVYARDSDRDADELVVLDLDNGKSCRLAGARWFQRFRDGFLYQSEVDAQGRGTLRFADAACRVQAFELAHASVPRSRAESAESFYLYASRNLVAANPLQDTSRVVIEDVTPLFGDWLLTGSGELLQFDFASGRVQGRFGTNVKNVAQSLTGEVLFEDEGGIHSIPSMGEEARTLTTDGCELARYGDWLGYYSPCEARVAQAFLRQGEEVTLGTIPLGATLLLEAREYLIQINQAAAQKRFLRAYYFRDGDTDADSGSLYYVDHELPTDGATTFGGVNEHIIEPVGERYPPHEFGKERWVSDNASISGLSKFARSGLALVDVSGETETGKLVATTGDVPLELVDGAANQSRLGPSLPYFFGDVQDGVGNLYSVCTFCSPQSATKAYEQIPLRGNLGFLAGEGASDSGFQTVYYDQDAILLQDFDGATGNVVRLQDKSILAQGVPAAGFSGLYFMQYGLAYLSDYDARSQTGTLYYYNSKLDARGVIARGVSQHIAAGVLPRAGVVYVQSEGTTPGLYIADAKR